jgi:hypothetical protein
MNYKSLVARIRFEVAEINVETANDDSGPQNPDAQEEAARVLVQRAACDLPEDHWEDQSFITSDNYEPWVVVLVSEDELTDPEDGTIDDTFSLLESFDRHFYVLLEGDTDAGEGRLILQPWFNAKNKGLLEYDILGDWIRDLKTVHGHFDSD